MITRFRAALLAATAVATMVATLATTSAAGAARAPGGLTAHRMTASQVRELRAQLRAGTLGRTHASTAICAAAHLSCQAQVLSAGDSSGDAALSGASAIGYGPAELEAAYGLARHGGRRATIAVIEAGAYPSLDADLAMYRRTFQLPACRAATGCLRQVNFRGDTPYPAPTRSIARWSDEQFAVEAALDVDMASAACPDCHILELQMPYADGFVGNTTGETHRSVLHLATAVATARRLGASAVGISFLYPADDYSDTGAIAAMMTQPGMPVVASSGDHGFQGGDARWPQNLPTVVSAGGTSLYRADTARGYTETAWQGSGSSCAPGVRPAVGQPATVSAQCGGARAGSDIAAVADPATGVAVYDTYAPGSHYSRGFLVSGGTSASAPFIAALFARSPRQPHELGTDILYTRPESAFNDVVSGSNAEAGACPASDIGEPLCEAGPGWDGPTGLGTPSGDTTFR